MSLQGFNFHDLDSLRKKLRAGAVLWSYEERNAVKESIKVAEHQLNALIPAAIQNLQEYVRLQKASINHISTLPQELLSEVFLYFTYSSDPCPMFDSASHPSVLAQVSSFWRETAHSTPSLWTSFSISCASFKNPSVSRTIGFIRDHIKCSKRRPLRFRLELFATCSWRFTMEGIPLLVEECQRWQSCTLVNLTESSLSLFTPVHGNLPLLEHLCIRGASGFAVSTPLITIFDKAPSLTKVDLLSISIPQITLPWAQFHKLSVGNKGVAALSSMAEDLGNLHDIHIVADEFNPSGILPPDSVTLPNAIHTLSLIASNPMIWKWSKIHNRLLLPPTLLNLNIYARSSEMNGHGPTILLNLLSRSYLSNGSPSRIHTLSLSEGLEPSSHIDMRKALAHLPELSHLTVSLPSRSKRNFAFFGEGGNILPLTLMFQGENEVQPCPQLATLVVKKIEVSRWEMMFELGKVVSNRRDWVRDGVPGASALQTIRLEFVHLGESNVRVETLSGVPVECVAIHSELLGSEWDWLQDVAHDDEDEDL
ncbi:hypothetical protein DL96DRAFT_1808787 [Flagelloscypha sp. PMI_526]|nr:hypothetical protein DL96DRAFT_1808787 [Flagelloscypha sp. PMI_526]